jgi:hypothetical protein
VIRLLKVSHYLNNYEDTNELWLQLGRMIKLVHPTLCSIIYTYYNMGDNKGHHSYTHLIPAIAN